MASTQQITATSVRALKNALRKETRQRLAQLPADIVDQESKRIVQRLLALKEYRDSKNISVFVSMPSGEIQTAEIIRDLLDSGKNCYIPRCDGDNMEMVKLRSWHDYETLPLNKWKIPEPPLNEKRETALDRDGLDLIVMPGLAFDKSGWRLGHGKGYYDKYLQRARDWSQQHGSSAPVTVALALSEQIVDAPVPRDEYDQRPDILLTPSGILGQVDEL
ncbi:5-formyltetrahydrofolate cyclo-ligase [Gaertneriomyces semiglobifer]|nr:5-formyltetrahydrofolate cyclo-ligase [Gaertneriomyces semiglobifer]